jgi:C-terminal processing protease CtpA/Prc
MRQLFLLLTVTLLASGAAVAQTTAPVRLSAKDLRADVAILRRAYETLHPGLYRYNTPEQMDKAFLDLESEFQQDRTLAEAYLAFSVFAAKVRCGHTYPNFYNQTDAVQNALFRSGRVPFYFRWLGGRMIVTKSFATAPQLRAGTEVLEINGTPVATILKRLMTVARADGGNDAKRVPYLEVQGTDRYEAFDVYFPLFFPYSDPLMTLRVRNQEETTIQVQPLTDEQRLAPIKAREEAREGDTPVWDFRLDAGIGYLRMPTWALYDSKWDWKTFLSRTFETLVKSQAGDLVIDLRGNEGGLGVGDVIVSHLITKDLAEESIVRRVRYRKAPEDLLPYLDTWDPSFKDWGEAAKDPKDGFYRLVRYDDDERGSAIKPALPTFKGRIWVLVGAANSSATFEFAQTVQQNRLGTLVGQPTGGNQRGINGGAFFFLRLPGSKIEMDLPLIGTFRDGNRPDAGLEPDIKVIPTVEDIASGRDAEMEAVRAELKKKQALLDASGRLGFRRPQGDFPPRQDDSSPLPEVSLR